MQVARVERPGEVTARVWERGVGETAASGTSAVAVAAATHGDGEVVVHFPGGDLRVRLAGGRAWLTGPAEPLDELPGSAQKPARTRSSFPISSPARAEGELPHPLGGAWLVDALATPNASGADLELAQHVVQRHPVVDSSRQPTISGVGSPYVPAGNSLGRTPGTTTARGGT